MSMLEGRLSLRPYEYPWAVKFTQDQQSIHWLPEEVPMFKDVKDWNMNLSEAELNLAKNIMLLFTQSDIDVGNGYLDHYLQKIKNPEVRFMLTTFAAQEVIHVMAYSHLIESLGLPESTYTEFVNYKEMLEKHEHIMSMQSDTPRNLAITMAVFGGFVEGLQLFASFIMLLNFQRFGKLRGMGQIVAWSVRDETLHCTAVCRMFREFIKENEISPESIRADIYFHCGAAVAHEDAFIDKAFEMGGVEGLTADDVKHYIRYVADRRLEMLGFEPVYGVTQDPQPWFEEVIGGVEHANFFENTSTAYTKNGGTGDWF